MIKFNLDQATVIESAEFVRENWENGGGTDLWLEKYEFEGKVFEVTYAFDHEEIGEKLAEDYPWDEEHIYEIEEVEE